MGSNRANSPRVEGVELTKSWSCSTSSGIKISGSSSLLDEEDGRGTMGLDWSSANLLVEAQKRKFPNMLPWGEPPGMTLGWEYVDPILTAIVLLYRKAVMISIERSLVFNSARDSKHFV